MHSWHILLNTEYIQGVPKKSTINNNDNNDNNDNDDNDNNDYKNLQKSVLVCLFHQYLADAVRTTMWQASAL